MGARPLLLAGGGLANGLLALRLTQRRPDVAFLLLEGGERLGGNHTWCFHQSDLTEAQREWVDPLVGHRWASHDVLFPGFTRRLGGTYHAVRSADFHQVLEARLAERVRLRCRLREVGQDWVTLENGERLEGCAVLDGRGFAGGLEGRWAYQKFLGQELELAAPHGLEAPVLMDARVEQLDGFRFVYLLPWSARSLLVEDTYYSDTPTLELDTLRARIRAYCDARGWQVTQVGREEFAALPLPLDAPRPSVPGLGLGVRAGFFHATTGYSFADAVRVADALASAPSLEREALARLLDRQARAQWRRQGFFRLLNRMLFLAAAPAERRRVFESFYGHTEARIGRFYAGQLGGADLLSVLARGASTVPTGAAVRAATGYG